VRLALIGGCITAALALAACGSSSKSSTSSTNGSGTGSSAASTTSAPSGGLPIVLMNYKFQPAVIHGTGGHTVTLNLKNNGTVEHNFSVASQHIDQDLEPGKSATVKLTLPKSGTVQFFCSYHKSKGMVGSFTLGGASPSAPPPTNTSTSGSGGNGY
jgi:plastocyanin